MGLNFDKLRTTLNKATSSPFDRFEIKEGENLIRVLPRSTQYFESTDDDFCYIFGIHYNIGLDNETVECLKNVKQRCPICDAVKQLYGTNLEADKQLASQIKASRRHIFNIIDLSAPEKGIQVMETGPRIYEDLLKIIARNDLFGDVLDLKTGRSFLLTKIPKEKTGTGFVNYSVTHLEPSDVTSMLPKDWETQLNSLSSNIPEPRYNKEQIEALLNGESVEDVATPPATTPAPAVTVPSQTPVQQVAPPVTQPAPVTPPPAQTPKVAAPPVTAPPVAPAAPPAAQTEIPECFGTAYKPKSEQCASCQYKKKCMKAFLED